jgi:type VI protein secretion system component Hcp
MNLFRSLFGEKCGVKVGKQGRSRLRPGVASLENRCLAAVDAFIWFNPASTNVAQFSGENTSKPAFEIKDFSFGVENPTTIGSATGGAGAGKVKFNEFTIKTTTDSASPAFFTNGAVGAHYKTVTIEVRKAGGSPLSAGKPYLQYKFSTVFTTKIDWSGPGDEGPEESITFEFGKLRTKYEKQETIGPVGETVATTASGQSASIPGLTSGSVGGTVAPAGSGQSNSIPGLTMCPPASNPNRTLIS